ncbi:site-specific tyrosine recombinase XerD [Streptococcus sp. E17BB]|uniref:site-specific tyrosine recombinase XerD n=1 Tax=Streptococcus sp. E17BB TaxID=3278714 RepID=UPI00359F0C02
MANNLERFLASKELSENSRAAYTYDLQQFLEVVGDEMTSSKLQVYETTISTLKPAARRRKLSTINQFLLYLYEQGEVGTYHRLKPLDKVKQTTTQLPIRDLSVLFSETDQTAGQLIALLIWQLGLTPSEIQSIKQADINLDFRMLTIKKGELIRVLPLPENLVPYLERVQAGTYLFDKNGKSYSRQWLFNRLSHYLTSLELGDLTAQKLRQQYIITELSRGVSQASLAKQLGLKTTQTLMTYETHGH